MNYQVYNYINDVFRLFNEIYHSKFILRVKNLFINSFCFPLDLFIHFIASLWAHSAENPPKESDLGLGFSPLA